MTLMPARTARIMQELLQEMTAQVEMKQQLLNDSTETNKRLMETVEGLMAELLELKQSIRRELAADIPLNHRRREIVMNAIFIRLKAMVATDD